MKQSCYKIKPVDGKGLGVIATRTIKSGDIIIQETPITTNWYELELGVTPLNRWVELAKGVDSALKTFDVNNSYKLCYNKVNLVRFAKDVANPTPKEIQLAQLATNSFLDSHPMRPDLYRRALFLTASFINHSCYPNACLINNYVVACQDIKEGEEISITYTSDDAFLPYDRRQESIKKEWDFVCKCSRCITPLPTDVLLTSTKDGGMTATDVTKMKMMYERLVDRAPNRYTVSYVEALKTFMSFNLHNLHWRKIKVQRLLVAYYEQVIDIRMLGKNLEHIVIANRNFLPRFHIAKHGPLDKLRMIYQNKGENESSLDNLDPDWRTILQICLKCKDGEFIM